MYLGMVFILIGIAVLIGSLGPFALRRRPPFFVGGRRLFKEGQGLLRIALAPAARGEQKQRLWIRRVLAHFTFGEAPGSGKVALVKTTPTFI